MQEREGRWGKKPRFHRVDARVFELIRAPPATILEVSLYIGKA